MSIIRIEMSRIGFRLTLGSQLTALFREVVKLLRGWSLSSGKSHWRVEGRLYNPTPLPVGVCFLNASYKCSVTGCHTLLLPFLPANMETIP